MPRSIPRFPVRPGMSRRTFVRIASLGLASLCLFEGRDLAFAAKASDETLAALDSAQAQYQAAMAELSAIGMQLEEAEYNLAACQAALDETVAQIALLEESIAQKQVELSQAQDVLADRVSASYRAGNADLLGVLLDATSFDDFVSRLYYAGKVSDADAAAIQAVKDLKAQLELQEQQLQEQRAQQEQLLIDQQAYTEELASAVAYYESYTAGLSYEVQALMEQAQRELLAAQQAEYEEYLRQQEALQNQQNQGSQNGQDNQGAQGGQDDGGSQDGSSPVEPAPEEGLEPTPEPSIPEPEPEAPQPEPPQPDPSPVEPDDWGDSDSGGSWDGGYSGGNHVYAVADIAWNYIGIPYVWGGTTPNGFDCSGLAQYCYAQAGYYITRTTYTQAAQISALGQMTYNMGDLQPGDLVFPHAGHVGIYMGGGMMIHAPYPGEFVQYAPVYAFSFGGCPV